MQNPISQPVQVSCPVCNSEDAKFLFETSDFVFRCSDHKFNVRRCKACSVGYLSPRPQRKDMGAYYPPEFYWSWEGESGQMNWDTILKKREAQLKAKYAWLEELPPGRLLDIGAQKGEFLWQMQKQGWKVEGVELDETVPNPAQMPIRYGDFLTMEFEDGVYDVITFWAVLEHVYEPNEFIEKASRLLRPGGKIIGLVTNLNSVQSRLYTADDYPRHLTLFTKKSLRILGRNNNLLLTKTKTDQRIFGGSLNGGLLYAVKRVLGYSADQALSEWKQIDAPDLFWTTWRGRKSHAIRAISKLDRILTLPLEKMLDRLGFGFILTFEYSKPDNDGQGQA